MDQTLIQNIPLEQFINGENIRQRYDEEKLGGLARSICESGLREPIHVIPVPGDRFMVLTGGRRLRAAIAAGLKTIPAFIEPADLSKPEKLTLQIIENVQREDLTPLEKAKAIGLLMKESGWNASQVGKKLGLTNGTVSKLLSCLSLSEELQQKIDSGELPVTAAYQLTQLNDTNERNQLAGQIASGALTRDDLSNAVQRKKHRPRKRAARPARVTAKLQSRETICVSAPALDLNSFVSILERLLGHAQQAVTEGLTLEALLKRLAARRGVAIGPNEAA